MMETITLQNIKFKYPKTQKYLFNNLNIEFYNDKINVVVGYNGAGKTTMFDILSNIVSIESGVINHVPSKEDILYQTQAANLFGSLKGKDVVRFILGTSKKKREIDINQLEIRERELWNNLWERKVGDMSVGERRWLLIFILIHLDKKVYIFDEPTTGVDPYSRRKILKKLSLLASQKESIVIMSTHNLQEIAFVDCHINLLHKGEIAFKGNYHQFVSISESKDPDEAFEYYTVSSF